MTRVIRCGVATLLCLAALGAPRVFAQGALPTEDPLINDNYFCRIVLPHQRMLPHASRKIRTRSVPILGGAIVVGENQPSGSIRTPRLHSSLKRPQIRR